MILGANGLGLCTIRHWWIYGSLRVGRFCGHDYLMGLIKPLFLAAAEAGLSIGYWPSPPPPDGPFSESHREWFAGGWFLFFPHGFWHHKPGRVRSVIILLFRKVGGSAARLGRKLSTFDPFSVSSSPFPTGPVCPSWWWLSSCLGFQSLGHTNGLLHGKRIVARAFIVNLWPLSDIAIGGWPRGSGTSGRTSWAHFFGADLVSLWGKVCFEWIS